MGKVKKQKVEGKGIEIVCPPDRHIPVEFNDIYALVRTGMSISERLRFEQIAQLVESLYAQEFMILKRNIKHHFLRFSMGAKDQPLITCVGGGLPTTAELDTAEQKLVADVLQLMIAARFHLLSAAEWELAKADKFMFSLPVEVNWKFYDDKMLKSFWASSTERRALRELLPDMADRVLVFHRGITVSQASGMYTSEKIDMLVDYLITQPLFKFWNWLRGKSGKRPDPYRFLSSFNSTHSARKVVERRTLRLLMPTAWSVIKNFPKKLKLQEPAFKEVVVVYRACDGGSRLKKHKVPAMQRPVEQRQREILRNRNVHVKCFHDIPMADMDVIFADKTVYLKMLTIIQMVITVVGGLVAALTVIIKEGGTGVDLNVLWSSLSLVAARCGQVYTSAQAERSKTIQDMVNILYDKTNDAQEGVVSMLLEDMADQQLKEAILTYGLLYSREAEMTGNMIDLDCERFLSKNFDLKIDFAVEDALPRLENWGLVRRHLHMATGNVKYEAVHVEAACTALQKHWQNAFKTLSEPPPTAQYPLTNLLSDAERAPALNADTLYKPFDDKADAAGAANGQPPATQQSHGAGFMGALNALNPLPMLGASQSAPVPTGSPGAGTAGAAASKPGLFSTFSKSRNGSTKKSA